VDWFTSLTEAIAAKRPVALVTVVAAPGLPALAGRHLVVEPGVGAPRAVVADFADDAVTERLAARAGEALESGKAGTAEVAGVRAYFEPFLPPPALVVVGAGHVAQPVAHLGKLLGFEVTVIDDRAEYATAARFPDADQVLCQPFVPALRSLDLGPRHHLVIVTRGHRYDMDCLKESITLPVAYIGMIGSRNRVETVFRLLEEEDGIDPAYFERVYSPIGLDINARSPAEIAVAVAAELLKVRNGGTGESLSRLGRAKVHGR
jgi:xanthine dehydrogenase accessory factor